MNTAYKISLLISLFFLSSKIQAQTAKPYAGLVSKPIGSATSSLPKWSNPSTWNNNRVPLVTDDVTIPEGATVVLDQNVDVTHIMVHGTLVIEPSKDVVINAHSLLIMGSNAYFEWGTELSPYKKKGVMTLSKSSATEIMPMSGTQSKGIMVMDGGIMEIHGKQQVPWTQLAVTAPVGTTTLTFKQPVDWNVNDEIVIASSELLKNTIDAIGITTPVDPYIYENEKATISSISGDKKTVTLVDPLQYQHWGGAPEVFTNVNGKSWTLDERAEVGLLSRNILIQGDEASETDRHGAYLMVMHGSSAKVSGVELYRTGIGSALGRYPFHWHMCNDVSGQYFNNNSVHHSFNRAITVHGSQNARLEANVVFDIVGHAIFLEDGIETGNVIDSNLVMTVNKPVKGQELLFSDRMPNIDSRGAGPSAIWISHPTNTITNNRVSGSGSGIWFACPLYPSGLSFTKTIKPREAPLGKLDNNTLHSCIVGLTFDFAVSIDANTGVIDNTQMDGAPFNPTSLQTITNVKAYKNKRGIWFRGGNNVQFDGFVLADHSGNGSFVPTFKTKFKNGCSIGHSKNNTKIDFLSYGLAYYDGAQDTEDCHFVNYDQRNQSILNIFGGANKVIYNTLKGITYQNCNLYNPLGTLEASPNNSFALDYDGSLTAQPNSLICLDHPFFVDDVNFTTLKSKNGGGFEWGKQTSTLKFGQIKITREQDQLNNNMLYYEWQTPTSNSNGGMHDTGVPGSPFGQASVAVNTNRIYKIRYCDTIPAETKWQLSFSYAVKDEVYAILQGSPEQLVAISGATTVTSIAAVKATTSNNAIFWDASKNELHVKLVAVNGSPLSAFSNLLTLGTKSGNKLVAQTVGINSRPYNDVPNLVGNLVQAENFDNGGQNIAYYSNVRYNFIEDKIGSPGIKMTTHLLPSSDYLHTTEVRTGEIVKLNNSFKTTLGANAVVIEKISPGEFWNYTFNVSADGTFDIDMQIAASGTSNKWQIFIDDVMVQDTSFASLGSANDIQSVIFPNIKLTKGTRIVTIKALSGNMAFDNFKIQKRTNVITGLEQGYEASKCAVYPNPSHDGNFQLSEPVSWKVYNIHGLEIQNGIGNSINLSENPKGVYLLKFAENIERVVIE